jgi:hypothetical protein
LAVYSGKIWGRDFFMPRTQQEFSKNKKSDAVLAAHGWENDLSDEEILERLLKLSLERSRE